LVVSLFWFSEYTSVSILLSFEQNHDTEARKDDSAS
jgi:hypothetical protein